MAKNNFLEYFQMGKNTFFFLKITIFGNSTTLQRRMSGKKLLAVIQLLWPPPFGHRRQSILLSLFSPSKQEVRSK